MPSFPTLVNATHDSMNGLLFAATAMEFASLARLAELQGMSAVSVNLYTMSIEIAFKSLALRSGASLKECEKSAHDISKMFSMIEKHGVEIPEILDRKLNDPKSFKNRLLGTRYTVFDPKELVTYHKHYFEMIAQILEIPCPRPLTFKGGSAIAELHSLVVQLQLPAKDNT